MASLGTTVLASYTGPSESLVPRPHGNEARQLSAPISGILECQYGLSGSLLGHSSIKGLHAVTMHCYLDPVVVILELAC